MKIKLLKLNRLRAIGALSLATLALSAGCGDDNNDPAGSATFEVTIENVTATPAFAASGVFNTPVGANEPGPLPPGQSYEIKFTAAPGYPGRPGTTRVSFAAMFVPSNDLFFAPAEGGISLFNPDGSPRSGDVTADVDVWDAGTEMDQILNGSMAESPNQKPYQRPADEDIGPADPNPNVRLASVTYPGLIPAIDSLLTVTLSNAQVAGATEFTLTIENVSTPGLLGAGGAFGGAVPLSPGAWAVYNYADGNPGPFFTSGEADRDEGIDDIAEDGAAARLVASAQASTGLITVSSPGLWTVHESDFSLFVAGEDVPGDGLEAIAEDGSAAALLAILSANTSGSVASSGAIGEMPLPPGMTYTFEVSAEAGQRLSLATMFVPSNDILFATAPSGIELFDTDGNPISGDITGSVMLWDSGTEINQEPGVGVDQVHLQTAIDTGAADANTQVRLVDDGFEYPAVNAALKITITPKS